MRRWLAGFLQSTRHDWSSRRNQRSHPHRRRETGAGGDPARTRAIGSIPRRGGARRAGRRCPAKDDWSVQPDAVGCVTSQGRHRRSSKGRRTRDRVKNVGAAIQRRCAEGAEYRPIGGRCRHHGWPRRYSYHCSNRTGGGRGRCERSQTSRKPRVSSRQNESQARHGARARQQLGATSDARAPARNAAGRRNTADRDATNSTADNAPNADCRRSTASTSNDRAGRDRQPTSIQNRSERLKPYRIGPAYASRIREASGDSRGARRGPWTSGRCPRRRTERPKHVAGGTGAHYAAAIGRRSWQFDPGNPYAGQSTR
ncbi:hypothetical protein SAMN05421828_11945 [Acidiphilium rubrum]|uniref:Uncharacterized protein n=1 Tax=Acidiphilium rubrum TaxID=526 RepID=A0A8G2CNK3_ACIRU|nr:hypothetical protein SAMN05421828_11945 [Acidiphilium rubrum]